MHGTNLYVGGSFRNAGGQLVNNIARWDGTAWASVQGGIDRRVDALAVAPGGDLYVGGDFTFAGCRVSQYFARFRAPEVRLTSMAKAADRATLHGFGEPNATYVIEATGDLVSPFVELGAATAGADGAFSFEDPVGSAVLRRFYRARLR